MNKAIKYAKTHLALVLDGRAGPSHVEGVEDILRAYWYTYNLTDQDFEIWMGVCRRVWKIATHRQS